MVGEREGAAALDHAERQAGQGTCRALRCSLSFWVPRVSSAAGPVVYDLLTAAGRLLSRYTINQSLDAGLYVATPAYHLTGGQLRVRLASTGRGSAVIIAASVNVGCS